MKSGRILNLLVAIAALALSLSAWGQATTSLRGVVTDPSGAAIPNAKVTITNVDTNLTRQTSTTSAGAYGFASVLPGTYKLTVEATGFRAYAQTGLQLMVNLPSTVNVQLQVGAVSQMVQVTGRAPQINTSNASLGQTMGTSAVENLPLRAENTALLLSLQPGVVYTGDNIPYDATYDTRSGAVNGERSDQNNITLDGVSNNDEFSGYAFNGILPTTPFSVQEFRVTTSNYGATQGHTAGAQIAMVTKSGTNQFHGSLYEFNRNTLGEANEYFLKSSEAANGQPNSAQHLVRNIFGGTVGGPFMKNRFFFFFNYEGRRQSLAASAARTIPSATLRDGIIQYACATPSACPAMNVTGASGKPHAVKAGYYGLGPAQLAGMDPLGIGPSQVALDYFNKTFPLPNDSSIGDGVNYSGYRFAAPTKESYNWYIGRLDYKLTQNGNQTLFFRGTGVDDRSTGAPFLPGTPPETSNVSLSKGFVLGYTGVFGAHWVNSFRYGLTRASYGNIGDSSQSWIVMRGLSQGITRSSTWVSPVHNFIDTASWLKGSHNFQFGGNFLLMRALASSNGNSFSDALTNSDYVFSGGFANLNSPLDPAYGCGSSGPCYPAISSTFDHSYDFPLAAMMGIASEVDARYNYKIDSVTSATALGQGASVVRHWAADSYNLYFEDTWQALPTLTVSYGLNYQLMTPVTETKGQEVTPTVNMGTWFNTRAVDAQKGIPSSQDAPIVFAPAGSSWGKPGFYSSQTRNFAPRIGLAWNPRPSGGLLEKIVGNGKTSVRAGFGMYYDNFGPELAMRWSGAGGSFGLSTSIPSSPGIALVNTPRITGMHTIPTTALDGSQIMASAPPSTYPLNFPNVEQGGLPGIDQSVKTPYSYAIDLSIERSLPGQMTLDMAYVGHFAHRLMVYQDTAEPLNLVDPKSGISYFTAVQRLAQLARQGTPDSSITAAMVGPTAKYWQDMVAPQASYNLCSSSATTTDPVVASYDIFGPHCTMHNETLGLWLMDLGKYAHLGLPRFATGSNSFYNPQFSNIFTWRSIGYSNYNALQIGLHKQMSHGLLFGFNYTYSKSLDIESEAERGGRANFDVVINSWMPYQLYGPSNFDLRHQINYYWVAQLPFGHGHLIGGNVARWADAIIGGWQLSGTGRWTSGFPGSVFSGYKWPTNWWDMGFSSLTGQPIKTGTETSVNGTPNIFTDPTAARAGFDWTFPGQSGVRNVIRGEGYFGLDMSLAKQWALPKLEHQTLQLRWNVYNVLNTNRFDVGSVNLEADSSSFGNYGSTMNKPRVMELSMVYSF